MARTATGRMTASLPKPAKALSTGSNPVMVREQDAQCRHIGGDQLQGEEHESYNDSA
ncbi:MAG: hypothetical protein ACLFU8_09205 [Anaerolineales bacterium]